MREVLQSKIHCATVTEANLEYRGSITVDQDLMEKVDLWPNQKVLVVSITTGQRLETYVIRGESGSGKMCMNGAAAHLIKKDEKIIVMGFESRDAPGPPAKCILVDDDNRFVRFIEEEA
jgi:aspartate 1-decarboxylase